MQNNSKANQATVLFIPHGAGPYPLLDRSDHQELVTFLKAIPNSINEPTAIIVISAHWETDIVQITSGKSPSLIYDYSGFPDEAYEIEYPASGDPELAKKIYKYLLDHEISAELDDERGFDHGVFVPLKIMYPNAHIPCVQISLLNSLDSSAHIQIGKALSKLKDENVLILGSGFTFHNLRSFFTDTSDSHGQKNEAFEQWLIQICTNNALSEDHREKELSNWSNAPDARYCHPREEHLLPLHVCYGIAGTSAELVFDGMVMGKKTSAFIWKG